MLGHVPDQAPLPSGRFAEDVEGPRRKVLQPEDRLQQRRFPGSVGSEDRGEGARADLDADVLPHDTPTEHDRGVSSFDRRRGSRGGVDHLRMLAPVAFPARAASSS